MTDAAAYPSCTHGKKIYERCESCEADARAGKHGGFERAPLASNERNLLPCPFCGSAAQVFGKNIVGCIETVKCTATVDFGHYDGLDEVVAAWNRRAVETPAEESDSGWYVEEWCGGDDWRRHAVAHIWEYAADAREQLDELMHRYQNTTFRLAQKTSPNQGE